MVTGLTGGGPAGVEYSHVLLKKVTNVGEKKKVFER
jgi:hypothetical protein